MKHKRNTGDACDRSHDMQGLVGSVVQTFTQARSVADVTGSGSNNVNH